MRPASIANVRDRNREEPAGEAAEPSIRLPDRRELRRLLAGQYEDGFVIRDIRAAPCFGGPVFVIDATWEGDGLRFLASLNRNGAFSQQSAMSRSRPDRLVFHYERLMALAFAFVERPRSALLLGLGGGAMWRHLRTVLPSCELTIVERDPIIIELARRHFFLMAPVVEADALAFIKNPPRRYDLILVDMYHSGGVQEYARDFWNDCLAAMEPDGLIAVNWAEFQQQEIYRAPAEALAAIVGASVFVTPTDMKDNLIQYAPTEAGFREETLLARLTRFDRLHRPCVLGDGPRSRSALRHCVILDAYPVIAAGDH